MWPIPEPLPPTSQPSDISDCRYTISVQRDIRDCRSTLPVQRQRASDVVLMSSDMEYTQETISPYNCKVPLGAYAVKISPTKVHTQSKTSSTQMTKSQLYVLIQHRALGSFWRLTRRFHAHVDVVDLWNSILLSRPSVNCLLVSNSVNRESLDWLNTHRLCQPPWLLRWLLSWSRLREPENLQTHHIHRSYQVQWLLS
jgi:hypothetical protein